MKETCEQILKTYIKNNRSAKINSTQIRRTAQELNLTNKQYSRHMKKYGLITLISERYMNIPSEYEISEDLLPVYVQPEINITPKVYLSMMR